MSSLAASLPFFALLLLTSALFLHLRDLRLAFLRAATVLGILAVIVLEILSPIGLIHSNSLSIIWVSILCGILLFLMYSIRSSAGLELPRLELPGSFAEWCVAVGISLILLFTGIIAWFAPPNTWDALNYHMPRVAHWAQQGSLAHFATGIEFQNYLPPGASYLVLHLYILGRGDHWVNFVQWFAMAGSLIGVAWITWKLGAGRFGQWVAVAFAATLPMGILQATSAVNDYVVAFWMVCVAAELLDMEQSGISNTNLIFMAGAAGLALLTKHTAIPYLLPFAFFVAARFVQHRFHRRHIAGVLIGVALVAALNFGYLYRNFQTYGSIAGPGERVGNQATQTYDPRALLSNILRNASLQAGTPSRYVNKAIAIGITWVHQVVGIDVNDPRTTSEGVFRVKPPITHETVASNPLHAYFIFFGTLYIILRHRQVPGRIRVYSWLVLSSFFLLSILFKWKVTGARYQLPFFVLFAPSAGWMLERMRSQTLAVAIISALCVGSLPALFLNPSRPFFNDVKDSNVRSVFIESRDELYFANAAYEATPYLEITQLVRESICQDVGLVLPGGEIEYQIWALLGAPQSKQRLEWIVAGTPSARYADPDFKPCAVICLECSKLESFGGQLPLKIAFGDFRLFMQSDE